MPNVPSASLCHGAVSKRCSSWSESLCLFLVYLNPLYKPFPKTPELVLLGHQDYNVGFPSSQQLRSRWGQCVCSRNHPDKELEVNVWLLRYVKSPTGLNLNLRSHDKKQTLFNF